MMISDAVNKKLNQQVTHEMTASNQYLAMACSFDKMGLKTFAKRFGAQADEERGHALKIMKYIQEVGGTVTLDAVPRPNCDFDSARAIVEAAVNSELAVTRQINDLVALAEQENDYATRSFLQWFVDEQVEEVAAMTELLQWVTLAGEQNLFQVEARIERNMDAS